MRLYVYKKLRPKDTYSISHYWHGKKRNLETVCGHEVMASLRELSRQFPTFKGVEIQNTIPLDLKQRIRAEFPEDYD